MTLVRRSCGIYRRHSRLLTTLLIALCCYDQGSFVVNGQRFMRQGFSNNEDFGAEMKIEDNDAAVGMTREMFLMKDIRWRLPPINFYDTTDDIILSSSSVLDSTVRDHINKYLGGNKNRKKPIELQLFKKRGKFGLRAVGTMDDGRKLRAFWRQSTTDAIFDGSDTAPSSSNRGKATDFLKMSYDDAVKSRLFTVEFEVQLPPVTHRRFQKNSKKVLPSVIYQIPIESGSMNPKAIIPRGTGKVLVYPYGRSSSASQSTSNPASPSTVSSVLKPIPIGTCRVGVVQMRSGIVDPSWSKGRPIFRNGRNAGIML